MVYKAGEGDALTAAGLAGRLWPDSGAEELETLYKGLVVSHRDAVFLATAEGRAVGFAHCSLRYEYVEGAESSPTGYLEGIFIDAAYRRRGLAGELLAACEGWAKSQGCRELASDCALDNRDSLGFHLSSGFSEAGRIICFIKAL